MTKAEIVERAKGIVKLGEKQDSTDVGEWYMMSPADWLAEMEDFIEELAEMDVEE